MGEPNPPNPPAAGGGAGVLPNNPPPLGAGVVLNNPPVVGAGAGVLPNKPPPVAPAPAAGGGTPPPTPPVGGAFVDPALRYCIMTWLFILSWYAFSSASRCCNTFVLVSQAW